MKLPLRKVREMVQSKRVFEGNSVYGDWAAEKGALYVVYSYGTHWPLFIWSPLEQRWFENSSRYSTTTSRHRSACHPHCDTIQRPLQWMKDLIRLGRSELLETNELLDSLPMA